MREATPSPHVIPAKAGIQKRVRASYDSHARYRSRWIPAFAGMTWAVRGWVFSSFADVPVDYHHKILPEKLREKRKKRASS